MTRAGGLTEIGRARLRFGVTFVSVAVGLLALYSLPHAAHGVREDLFAWYLAGYAHTVGAVIHLTDPAVHLSGAEIVGRTSLIIANNCDAMDVNLLFVAAIVAFPARWPRRLAGIAAGLAALSLVNIVRIVTLYHVDLSRPTAFDFLHTEVWPFGMVVATVAAFAFWSRWSRQADARQS